jgi:dsRNA-specific ribonuclease
VEEILRSLTSKIYKHHKSENYEEFEFIGDVVLKYLATIQIFLERTTAEEGEMHIGRANIICNANLHRAAIKKHLFRYAFTTKKKSEPVPIVKETRLQNVKEERVRFTNTDIFVLGVNDDE